MLGIPNLLEDAARAEVRGAGMKAFDRTLEGRISKIAGKSLDRFPRGKRVVAGLSRHPYMVGGAVGAWTAGQALHGKFGRMAGPNVSSRNQNNMWLKSLRKSSGSMGLQGQSSGGYTM